MSDADTDGDSGTRLFRGRSSSWAPSRPLANSVSGYPKVCGRRRKSAGEGAFPRRSSVNPRLVTPRPVAMAMQIGANLHRYMPSVPVLTGSLDTATERCDLGVKQKHAEVAVSAIGPAIFAAAYGRALHPRRCRRLVASTLVAWLLCCLLVAAPAKANIPGGYGQGAVAYDSSSGGDSDLFARGPDGTVRRFEASMPGAEDARPAWAPEPSLRGRMAERFRRRGNDLRTRLRDRRLLLAAHGTTAVRSRRPHLGWRARPRGRFPGESDDTINVTSVPPGTTENSLVCVTKRAGLAVAPSFTVTGLNQHTSPRLSAELRGRLPRTAHSVPEQSQRRL